jgi:hypothetical protein
MISRLTVSAVVFAAFGTASLGFAAQLQPLRQLDKARDAAPTQVIVLPQVQVIGHRAR